MDPYLSNTPLLETDRLILRRFTTKDAPALFSILKDKQVNRFLPWFPLKTIEEARIHLQENYLKHYTEGTGYHYAICLKADSLPIGYINVSHGPSHDFGYGLKKEFWNQGIVTEGCRAVLELLKAAGLPYVTATHDIHNPRSGAVMKKLGMAYRYSYKEQWQPKNILVTFRMYQLNLDARTDRIFTKYWEQSPEHFIEQNI